MKQSMWRVMAFAALMGAMALPASAEVVIGGSNAPSVEVNWSVLDGLGRQPTLADMLKSDVPGAEARAPQAPAHAGAPGVQYRPYKPGANPYGKTAKSAHAAKPGKAAKPAKATPAKAKKGAVTPAPEVKAARAVAAPPAPPKAALTPVADTPKPTPIGPQIALPEMPKPAAASAPAAPPVQLVKAESAVAPKAEPKSAPLPPTALTPPPMPVAKAEAPQQIAALAPAAAPVAAALSSRGGDTLVVPFSAESARVPDSAHAGLDRLIKRMQQDEGLGLQLLAYAEGDEANASKARRLSLSRALEVRKYLMDQGLRSTRIEVRALGNKVENGPADRVDAVLVNR